jgi:hypothetical protein
MMRANVQKSFARCEASMLAALRPIWAAMVINSLQQM